MSSTTEMPADPSLALTGSNSRQLFFAVFPSIMLPMFLAAIDQTIVATALPAIAGSLGEVERVSWVVVSYLVASTIAAPVYGRLGDALGRRRMMFVALGVFIAASLWCAFSSSIVMLTVARVVQGLGGGGLMTLSQALVGEAVPPRERARYQGYMAGVFVCSSTFGPVAGGWLTQHFGWHSVFTVNLPLGLLALALAFRLPKRAVNAATFRFDFTGVVLFTLFIAPALLALEQVQRLDRQAIPMMLGLAAVAVVALLVLLKQQQRAAVPLLPIKLLRQTSIWRADLMASCIGASLVSMVTFVPIYLQVVRGTVAGQTGWLLLPLTAFIAVGSVATGRLIAWTGKTAVMPSFGLPVMTGCLVVLALFAPQITLGQLPFLFALLALSTGTAMPVVQLTVQMLAGPKQLGAAAASVQFSRSIGSAIGTAVVGAVLFASLAHSDPATAALFGQIVQRGPAALAGLTSGRVAVVQQEIADAFRAAFLTIACFAACGAVLAWSIPVRRLKG